MTKEGQQLLPEVEQLTRHLQSITALTESMRTEKEQTIRIGAAHACAHMVVAPTLVEYRQQQPDVHVDLVTEHFAALQQAVLNNELDVALVFGQYVPRSLFAEPLFQADMVAILPKEMTPPASVSLDWLSQHGKSQMTGTGACVFAGFDDKETADAVLAALPEHWQGFVAWGKNRSPLHSTLAI